MGQTKRRFGRRRDASNKERTAALVMPLLQAGDVDWHAVFARVATTLADLIELRPTVEGSVVTADIPGGGLGASLMPVAVPSNDLKGPIAGAYHWPDAAAAIAAHTQHAIIFANSDTLGAVDLHLLVSKVAAATLAIGNGIGMYVGHAMLVRDAAGYIGEVSTATRDNVPLLCWVGFNPVNDDGVMSAYTTGLTAFDLRELEVRRTSLDPDDAMNTLMNVASYQLETGKQLADGDTIGYSETDRTKVRYAQSAFIPDTEVAVLELPSADES